MSEVLPPVKTEDGTNQSVNQPTNQPMTSSQLIDRLIVSSDEVIALIQAMRAETVDSKRAALAAKVNGVWDHDLRECFLQNNGLVVLTSWLDVTSSNAVVLAALEALSVLPLTRSYIQSANELLCRLDVLKTHSNEVIAQLADDIAAACRHKLASPEDDDAIEQPADGISPAGHVRHIRIDKTTADMHAHQLAIHAPDASEIVKDVVFDTSITIPILPPMQIDDEEAGETTSAPVADSTKSDDATYGRTRSRSRSVSWVNDTSLETVRVYFSDDTVDRTQPLIKAELPSNQSMEPLKPTINWYPPRKLVLSSALQAMIQVRGTESKERHLQLERESKCARVATNELLNDPHPVDSSTKSITLESVNVRIPFNAKASATPTEGGAPTNSVSAIVATLNNVASSVSAQTKAQIPPATTISQSLASISTLIDHLAAPERQTNIKKEPKKKKYKEKAMDTKAPDTPNGPLVLFAPRSPANSSNSSKSKQAHQSTPKAQKDSKSVTFSRSPINGPSKGSPPLPKFAKSRLSNSSPKGYRRTPESSSFGGRPVAPVTSSQPPYPQPNFSPRFGKHALGYSNQNAPPAAYPSPPTQFKSSPSHAYPQPGRSNGPAYNDSTSEYHAPKYNSTNYGPTAPPAHAPSYPSAAPRYQRPPASAQQYVEAQPAYQQPHPQSATYNEQYYDQYEHPAYAETHQAPYVHPTGPSSQYEPAYEQSNEFPPPTSYQSSYSQPPPPPSRTYPTSTSRPARFAPPVSAARHPPPPSTATFSSYQGARTARAEPSGPYYPGVEQPAGYYADAPQQYEQPMYENAYEAYPAQPYEAYSEYEAPAPAPHYQQPSAQASYYPEPQYTTNDYAPPQRTSAAPPQSTPMYSQPGPSYAGQKRRRNPMYAGAGSQPMSRPRTG